MAKWLESGLRFQFFLTLARVRDRVVGEHENQILSPSFRMTRERNTRPLRSIICVTVR